MKNILRECYGCGSTKTEIRKHMRGCRGPVAVWHLNRPTNLCLCRSCFDRIIQMEKIRERGKRDVKYKNKIIILKFNPRKGFCINCGKIGRTEIHHLAYDDNDPLAHTVELCGRCHNICTAMGKPEAVGLVEKGIIKLPLAIPHMP